MDAQRFDKSKLPSRRVTEGYERAPHRSCYYAMGMREMPATTAALYGQGAVTHPGGQAETHVYADI